MDWLCGNTDHNQPYLIVLYSKHPYPCLIPLPLREDGNNKNEEQMSHH